MRVVSQKLDYSVDFDRTTFWTQGTYICAMIADQRVVFGVYESDERAKEVFQDIHKAYAPVGIISSYLNEEQIREFIRSKNIDMRVMKMNDRDAKAKIFHNTVYYMPEV